MYAAVTHSAYIRVYVRNILLNRRKSAVFAVICDKEEVLIRRLINIVAVNEVINNAISYLCHKNAR